LIDRALVLNSNLAEAWRSGGLVKTWLGEPELAIERFAGAMRLNPVDPLVMSMRSGTANAHFLLGRYDEAASWMAMALQAIRTINLVYASPPQSMQWPDDRSKHRRQWLGCGNSIQRCVFPLSKTW
jgi:tetratricopeptide (TPR) repeat protein